MKYFSLIGNSRWRRSVHISYISLLCLIGLSIGVLWTSVKAEKQLSEILEARLFLPISYKSDQDLIITDVKIIQGITQSPPYSVNIADRKTLVRVFVSSGSDSPVEGVTAQMCAVDDQEILVGCIPPDNGYITIPSIEADLQSTLNYSLPNSWTKPAYSFYIDLDPDQLVAGNYSHNRYPTSGTLPFNFVTVPNLEVVIVPIEYRPYPGNEVTRPNTEFDNYLTHLPTKVLPFPEVAYINASWFIYEPSDSSQNLDSSTGWVKLINDFKAKIDMEGRSGFEKYYGVVNSYDAHGCSNGCITGIAYVGGYTGVGWSGTGAGTEIASGTLTHELGHLLGRGHTKCAGNESNPDEGYPYVGGIIGQYGLDVESGVLYPPTSNYDYMSYCNDRWTSDYTYWNIFQYVQQNWHELLFLDEPKDSLYISGTIKGHGEVIYSPTYRQMTLLPEQAEGSHLLELISADGTVLGRHNFTPLHIADDDEIDIYRFGLFVPALEGISGMRIVIDGEILGEEYQSPSNEQLIFYHDVFAHKLDVEDNKLRWARGGDSRSDLVYRLRYSQDEGVTWNVLALDLPRPEFTLQEQIQILLQETWLEIQASDGLNTRTKVFRLDEGLIKP